MNKKILENTSKALPSFFKNSADYLKTFFEEKSKGVLENTGGTIGVLINLFAQPLIDKYFNKLSEHKLENYGLNTYLKASLSQARQSLDFLRHTTEQINNDDKLIFEIFERTIKEDINNFTKAQMLLIFQPIYHPAITFVRDNYIRILIELNLDDDSVKSFQKNYNENISETIIEQFGEDYQNHLAEIKKFRFQESETTFLFDTIKNGKIGFKENENLKYEPTYAQWCKVSDIRNQENEDVTNEKGVDIEDILKPIEQEIENYFQSSPDNHLEKILFIIADFGKGKSVFMRHYAASLAREYLTSGEGFFPIYFNLRNYKNYSIEPKLGVLSDYLETTYNIKIDDEHFENKKYLFLVDSLDESGDLNQKTIDKVIVSIKSIQGIDKSKYRTNRIIISSRPFDDGLVKHLTDHKPYTLKNIENRDIPYFLNIYGFRKKQFNDWLSDTLRTFSNANKFNASGLSKEIIESIENNNNYDIHAKLLENNTLSRSELRRPIFGYMVYQLMINNVDFISIGKLGVYLSFLNLLTKEAKHIHDLTYEVNLKEEFEFRNILHSTAALWMFERQTGKQGSLKKADLCRVLEGKNSFESDSSILDRFKGQGFTEIQFLSHSYFGENDNILHFQHQSFAEILLAEYYLKIFIKFGLDKDKDTEEARLRLMLGEPTAQTISFLNEMLILLKETSVDLKEPIIIEKRKLLFPLMASLATQKNNRLFSNDLYYDWYRHNEISENQTEYPKQALENWCFDSAKVEKIISLASEILNSNNQYTIAEGTQKNVLFNSEILHIATKNSSISLNIDKWISLLVGNVLYNDIDEEELKLFNTAYSIDYLELFDLIRNWNYSANSSSPSWGSNLFMGVDMRGNETSLDFSHYNFDGINFSFSYLKNIRTWHANWSRCILNYCHFWDIDFITSTFYSTEILEIASINERFIMQNCFISSYNFKLLDAFKRSNFFERSDDITYKENEIHYTDINREMGIFGTLRGFLKYGLENSIFTFKEVLSWFSYDSEETKNIFLDDVNTLKKFEIKRKKSHKGTA